MKDEISATPHDEFNPRRSYGPFAGEANANPVLARQLDVIENDLREMRGVLHELREALRCLLAKGS